MHITDVLLSPAVSGTIWVASTGTTVHCWNSAGKEIEARKLPLVGAMGAFNFAALQGELAFPPYNLHKECG